MLYSILDFENELFFDRYIFIDAEVLDNWVVIFNFSNFVRPICLFFARSLRFKVRFNVCDHYEDVYYILIGNYLNLVFSSGNVRLKDDNYNVENWALFDSCSEN